MCLFAVCAAASLATLTLALAALAVGAALATLLAAKTQEASNLAEEAGRRVGRSRGSGGRVDRVRRNIERRLRIQGRIILASVVATRIVRGVHSIWTHEISMRGCAYEYPFS